MAFSRSITPLSTSLAFAITLASLGLSGCEAYRNTEERAAAAKKLAAEAGSAGGGAAYYSDDCPNGVCLPDPGSRYLSQKDCEAIESGYEFYPVPVMDLEDVRARVEKNGSPATSGPPEENFALLSYTYDDSTTYSAGKLPLEGIAPLKPYGWEPAAEADLDKRCGRADNHVMHLKGGPFLEWGGGVGRALRCMNGNYEKLKALMVPANDFWESNFVPELRSDGKTPYAGNPAALNNIYCHVGTQNVGPVLKPTNACIDTANDPLAASACPERDKKVLADITDVTPEELPLIGVALDLSQWEGISFWARRTPNSQAGIRVLVGDKQTDDDVSSAQFFADPKAEPYCRRAFECACKDQNMPCTILKQADVDNYNENHDIRNDVAPPQVGDGVCWDPKTQKPFGELRTFQYCGSSACIHQSDSAKSLNMVYDPFIYGTQCREFTTRGSITTKLCYDPKSEYAVQQEPTEPARVCGDHWMQSVRLSYDWEFFTVPFTELLQQGWAKRSYLLDLTAVTMTRFTWDRGYLDIYLDDVRFYRKKK